MGRVEDGGGGEGAADLEHFRFEWPWYILRETNCTACNARDTDLLTSVVTH
jgi:hypothetical protein